MRSALTLVLLPAALLAETHQIVPSTYYRTFSHTNAVLKRIQPGDLVITQTVDSSGRDYKGEVRHPESGNPLTGPFFIEGAEPGDAIVVDLRKVRLNRDWGYSAYRLGLYSIAPETIEGLYPNRFKPGSVIPGRDSVIRWDLDRERNMVKLSDPSSAKAKLEFPSKPMLGCIGVAAPGDFAPTSGPAGSYGGNLDYNQIGEGAKVILPVYHRGALLFLGDGHALQGDGEPSGTGIETSMDVEFTVTLRKKANLSGPRVETADSIISVGAQPEFVSGLNRALQLATSDMASWLSRDYGFEPWAAHQMIAFQGKYDVVTVAGTMALRIPKLYLPSN